jgi:hypothetical protein
MPAKRTALLLVEGPTEERFYFLVAQQFFPAAPKRIKNLHGNWNINTKVADAVMQFADNHPGTPFDVYVCIDQERFGPPPFNPTFVQKQLSGVRSLRRIVPVIAILMIESLFFIDIEGIYRFLRTPNSSRKPQKFRQFRRLRHQDLTALFKRNSKRYQKGERCVGLVRALDLEKIVKTAPEVGVLIKNIKSAL